MANRYDTGNAVGSADPRDLFDNSIVIDEFANSSSETAVDRLGETRRTIVGLRADVAVAIGDAGYTGTGVDGAIEDYTAGIEITQYNQVVRDTSGEFWKVTGATNLPYTTTGAGIPEGGTFVSVGDFALRQDLADPAQGGGLVSVATSTGDQDLNEALDNRVIYADAVSDLSALTGMTEGQHANVGGVTFRYDGISWALSSDFITPEIYGATGDGVTDDSSAFSAIASSYPEGVKVVSDSEYLLSTPVAFSSKIIFEGGHFKHTTLAINGGLFRFDLGSDGSSLHGCTVEGPEDLASWEASDNSILYSSVYSDGVSNLSFEGVQSSGTRIAVSLVDCPNPRIKRFKHIGFLPNVQPPSTGGGALVPPYMAGINWAECIRLINCDDVLIEDAEADHHGNIVTIGGTCMRPIIRDIKVYHMHDNGVYLSSADQCIVGNVYAEDCRGSAVKARGSRSRIDNVFGSRCAIGVTVSPLPTSGISIPADQQIDTDAIVTNVEINDGFLIVLADSVNIDGTEVALSNVTFRGLRGFTLRGVSTLGAIRVTAAGEKVLVEDFFVNGCLADWPVQIGGIVNDPSYYVHNCVIRNGHVQGCNTIGRVFQSRGWAMENITSSDMASAASTTVIECRSSSDGIVREIRNNDTSYRIDCRHVDSLKTSVINCRAFVLDGPQIENYGNTTTSLKNITTTAPFKAGQICLTSGGNVAISAGTAIASWREIT